VFVAPFLYSIGIVHSIKIYSLFMIVHMISCGCGLRQYMSGMLSNVEMPVNLTPALLIVKNLVGRLEFV
jgi:hypothetical protein